MSILTVLMSAYNAENYIKEAIESILSQTFTDFEFIIINDASTDSTELIIKSFSDPRVKLIKNEKSLGLTKSLNIGLDLATGKYIVRMDADDIATPDRFQKQFDFMENNPDIDVCGTNYCLVDNEKAVSSLADDNDSIISQMLFYNSIAHPSVFIRGGTIKKYGLRYNESFKYAQDYEFWCRNLKNLKFANLPYVMLKYRHHDNNIGKTKKEEQMKYADEVRLFNLRNYLELELDEQKANFHNKIFRNPSEEFAVSRGALVWLNYLVKRVEAFGYKSDFLHKMIDIYKNRRFVFIRKTYSFLCRTKNKLLSKLFKKRTNLRTLILLMRNKCNARCIMCGLDYYGNRSDLEITFEKALKIFAKIDVESLRSLVFSGGGEPLLAKDFIQIVEYLNSRHSDIELSIYTNGIAMNGKKAEIIARRFKRVTISINASTPKIYRKIMGVDMFQNVVSNIKNLYKLKSEYQSNLEIELSFVVSALNIDDLPALVFVAKEVGAGSISVQYCRFYSSKIGASVCAMKEEDSLFYRQELSDKIMKELSNTAEKEGVVFGMEALFCDKPVSINCGFPGSTVLIDPEGYVFPCGGGEVMFHNAVHSGRMNFGNIFEMNIKDIFNLPDFQNIALNSNVSYEKRCLSQCRNCNHTIRMLGANDKRSHFIDIE